jgi:hypothetical protein
MKMIAAVIFALLLGGATIGCGKNACEAACEKLKECKAEGASGVNCSGECPSEFEAMMNCIADLSCTEVKDEAKMMACYKKK